MKKKYSLLALLILTQSLFAQWSQIGSDIDDEGLLGSHNFGWSTSINDSGSIVAVSGLNNQVRVFENTNGNWQQLGNSINGEASGDNFGQSISLNSDGTILAVGASRNDGNGNNSGHVRVFQNISNSWTQIGSDIDGEAENDRSGASVSLSGDGTVLAIGAYNNDGNGGFEKGHVRVFKYSNNIWTKIGSDIDGENDRDEFGFSVSLNNDGNVLAVGAPDNDGNGLNSGHTRIYQNISNNWTQIGNDIDGETSSNRSGIAVSLNNNGNIIAIGAEFNSDNGNLSGHARIYQNISNNWTQIGNDIDGENAGDRFGTAISLNGDGTIVAIGARNNDGNGSNAGHTRIFNNNNNNWQQTGVDIDGEASEDLSGFSVSLNDNGKILSVGATGNDAGGNGSGHARIFEFNEPTLSTNDNLKIKDNKIQIYPIPANNIINISLEKGLLKSIKLIDFNGRTVNSVNTNSNKYNLNLNRLSVGIYYLNIITNTDKLIFKKIVIE